MPSLLIVAGPNGAGKTTFAREFLTREAGFPPFLNADLIAASLSPQDPEGAALAAGRIMLGQIRDQVERLESFAFETTLAGKNYARLIPQWQSRGFFVRLAFLSLRSADSAVERVAIRVSHGGHSIPEPVIRRRFQAGLENFRDLYRPLVDKWEYFDNSGSLPILIEEGING